jgi:lipopolysaccharide cholinephosphotransferase
MDRTKILGEYNADLVNILKSVVSICETNHLRYFAAYGTAIGAVRHHGIIPWDDDIDLFMPRPDYEKFITLFNKSSDKLEIITPYNNKGFHLSFARVVDRSTTLLEEKDFKMAIGVFIDIFPLDGAPDNEEEQIKQINRIEHLCGLMYTFGYRFTYQRLRQMITTKQYLLLICSLLHIIPLCRRVVLRMIHGICLKYDYNTSPYIVSYVAGSQQSRSYYKKSWFDNYVIFPFESLKIKLPVGYDEYLKQEYGDYMTYPPVEERQYKHHIAYLNLHERISFDNVLKQLVSE